MDGFSIEKVRNGCRYSEYEIYIYDSGDVFFKILIGISLIFVLDIGERNRWMDFKKKKTERGDLDIGRLQYF